MTPREGSLSPQELQNAENHWINESQKSLGDRLRKGELKNLSPYGMVSFEWVVEQTKR